METAIVIGCMCDASGASVRYKRWWWWWWWWWWWHLYIPLGLQMVLCLGLEKTRIMLVVWFRFRLEKLYWSVTMSSWPYFPHVQFFLSGHSTLTLAITWHMKMFSLEWRLWICLRLMAGHQESYVVDTFLSSTLLKRKLLFPLRNLSKYS